MLAVRRSRSMRRAGTLTLMTDVDLEVRRPLRNLTSSPFLETETRLAVPRESFESRPRFPRRSPLRVHVWLRASARPGTPHGRPRRLELA
jgi:hypothetical protein